MLVRYVDTGEVVLSKNPDVVRPIASVTKLVSGLVLAALENLEAADTYVTITEEDKDRLKWSRSRVRVGLSFKARELLAAALAASDNRAMYAAVRAAGLSRGEFVERMNALVSELGMTNSVFQDPAGVDPKNVSTATDLLKLLEAAAGSEWVRESTRLREVELVDRAERVLRLGNPNRLVRSSVWEVVVGKTGYTVEAGRALVVRAKVGDRLVDMVFLGAREMASVFGDAGRVRRWLLTK